MSPKKVKESRTRYTAQAASARQPGSKRSSVSKAKPIGQSKSSTASRQSRARRTKAVFFTSGGFDEINQNLLDLKAGLADIQPAIPVLSLVTHLGTFPAP